jgi:uncharacterized membrane-anchored protein
MITRALLLLGALLVFGSVNWQIASKERVRANGHAVYLLFRPIDPRSLMQGDYMALTFQVASQIDGVDRMDEGSSHIAILQLDEHKVGKYVRLDDGTALKPDEQRFRFRVRNGAVWLGTNAFFFHEGDAQRYAAARYGEFRVNEEGDAMLVNLRDKDLQTMRALTTAP